MSDLIQKLKTIQDEVHQKLSSSTFDEKTLEEFKVHYLGRNGKLTQLLKDIGSLSLDQRPQFGKLANEVKESVSRKIENLSENIKKAQREKNLLREKIDVTLPPRCMDRGKLHPILHCMDDMVSIFSKYGFQTADGPDVETDYYNFEALNIPKHHPARDMQDTFYITDTSGPDSSGTDTSGKEDLLLRTHTSPVQIRVMEKFKPPLRIVVPGTVYRHDDDTSHSPMFHQVEGLLVDEKVSMAHLKGILTYFVRELFSSKTKVRFRPSFFPFTEPSAELDIECILCEGNGCRACKQSGWLEVAGCGMVHPNVFKAVRYDTEKWSGFAFGMGVERLAMLRYGVDNIKLFFENDLRFLRQF